MVGWLVEGLKIAFFSSPSFFFSKMRQIELGAFFFSFPCQGLTLSISLTCGEEKPFTRRLNLSLCGREKIAKIGPDFEALSHKIGIKMNFVVFSTVPYERM